MIAYFAGGCFWGIEEAFSMIKGVDYVISGYMGGSKESSYEEVCSGTTNHAETVKVEYDIDEVNFNILCKIFFMIHDATNQNIYNLDPTSQYRSEIFYTNDNQLFIVEEYLNSKKDLATRVTDANGLEFYRAEDYHQQFFKKNPSKLKTYFDNIPSIYLKPHI